METFNGIFNKREWKVAASALLLLDVKIPLFCLHVRGRARERECVARVLITCHSNRNPDPNRKESSSSSPRDEVARCWFRFSALHYSIVRLIRDTLGSNKDVRLFDAGCRALKEPECAPPHASGPWLNALINKFCQIRFFTAPRRRLRILARRYVRKVSTRFTYSWKWMVLPLLYIFFTGFIIFMRHFGRLI